MKATNLSLFTTLFIVFGSVIVEAAPTHYLAAADAKAIFLALGRPGLLKVRGEGAVVQGHLKVDGSTVVGQFEVDLNGFDTGIDLRNQHMKEKYLETQKHPKAVVEVQNVEVPVGWSPEQGLTGAKFNGFMTLKGVSKPIIGKVTVAGAQLKTEAEFSFSLKDFPVGVPSYMGITIAEVVQVNVMIPAFNVK